MSMITFEKILNIAKKTKLIPYLVGPHGEGKTTYIKELAKHLEKEVVIINLSAIESSDFCGLPYIEAGITHYAKPSFMTADILFLDEIDSTKDHAVKASLKSLLLDRKINGNELNPECLIFSAGNGVSDDYETIEFDKALSDRLVSIPFKYSDDEKIDYLNAKYKGNKFVNFIEVKPELLNEYSGRRIESFLQLNDSSYCEMFFSKETARLFHHFIESSLVSLDDIKKGVYDFNSLSTITKSSLVIDIVNAFYSLEKDDCQNVNKFVNLLRAEEKSNYFTRLKKICLENPEKFTATSTKLNEAGLFKGQKEYLTELTK